MKSLILGTTIALAGISADAMAVCTNPTRINTAKELVTLLSGNTVCVPVVTVPTMTWQELHVAGATGGDLIDYKRGPGHPIDPSKKVGTWRIDKAPTAPAVVIHTYDGGGSFTFTVHANTDGTHSFCGGAPEVVARIKTGGGAC